MSKKRGHLDKALDERKRSMSPRLVVKVESLRSSPSTTEKPGDDKPLVDPFYFYTGLGESTGETAISLTEFLAKIQVIDYRSLSFHLHRRDFQRWIIDQWGRKQLVQDLDHVSKSGSTGKELRQHLSTIIAQHIDPTKYLRDAPVKLPLAPRSLPSSTDTEVKAVLGRRMPWEHIVSMLLAFGLILWAVTGPNSGIRIGSMLGVHVPLTLILLYGPLAILLVGVFTFTRQELSRATWSIGVLYATLIMGPCLGAWILLSMARLAVEFALLVALIAPLTLLVNAVILPVDWRQRLRALGSRVPPRWLRRFQGLAELVVSLLVAYGTGIAVVAGYAVWTTQVFGTLLFRHLGLLIIGNAMVAGGLFGWMQRGDRQYRRLIDRKEPVNVGTLQSWSSTTR